jgi:hypothetical protein
VDCCGRQWTPVKLEPLVSGGVDGCGHRLGIYGSEGWDGSEGWEFESLRACEKPLVAGLPGVL